MTGFNSNLNELIVRFKAIKTGSQQVDFSDALVLGVNAAKASMQNRIFNRGEDKENVSLGKYVGPKKPTSKKLSKFLVGSAKSVQLSQYEKKRVGKGRQIRYKDLEFEGVLRRGIVVIKETPTSVICAIPNDKLIVIARGQEEYLKTLIFALSDSERKLMVTNVHAAIKQIYDRLFNP